MTRRPEEFTWRHAANPKPLSLWEDAPSAPGFYELGFLRKGRFDPKYGGRASELTLRERLKQHWRESHNRKIEVNKVELWYRCKDLPTAVHARVVEAHYITAFEYEWNNRQEWSQFLHEI